MLLLSFERQKQLCCGLSRVLVFNHLVQQDFPVMVSIVLVFLFVSLCRVGVANTHGESMNAVKCFVQNGLEEAAAFRLVFVELHLQPVAQGHQFIDFGDDSMLFSQGWEGNFE